MLVQAKSNSNCFIFFPQFLQLQSFHYIDLYYLVVNISLPSMTWPFHLSAVQSKEAQPVNFENVIFELLIELTITIQFNVRQLYCLFIGFLIKCGDAFSSKLSSGFESKLLFRVKSLSDSNLSESYTLKSSKLGVLILALYIPMAQFEPSRCVPLLNFL